MQASAPDSGTTLKRQQTIQQKTSKLKSKIEKYDRLRSLYEDTLVLIEMADEEGDLSMLDEVVSNVDAVQSSLEEQRLSTCLPVNMTPITRYLPSMQEQAVQKRRTGIRCLSECTPTGASATASRLIWSIFLTVRRQV